MNDLVDDEAIALQTLEGPTISGRNLQLSPALEAFVARAKELRNQAADALQKFFEFLYASERDASLWEGAACTFHEIIAHSNLCKISQYEKYKQVRQDFPELVKEVGIPATLAAAKVSKEQRKDFLLVSKQFKATNGVDQSYESADRQQREYKSREFVGRTGMVGHASLANENTRLQQQLRLKEEEVEILKLEVKTLKSQVKSLAKGAPKTKGKKT